MWKLVYLIKKGKDAVEKGVRGSETLMIWFIAEKVTLINSVISAASCQGDVTTYHSSSVGNENPK